MIYIASVLGSLVFILIRLKLEKQKSDDSPDYNFRIKKYALKEWDDWVFSFMIGLVLVFFQESIFYGYVEYAEWNYDKAIDFYTEAEIALAGANGLFGSLLIMILFKFVMRKAAKLSE